MNTQENVTFECCPHCGKEVELDAELKVQVCPNCGRHIVACSMCISENCATDCPLEILAKAMDEGTTDSVYSVPDRDDVDEKLKN